MGMRKVWVFTEKYSRQRLEPLLDPVRRLASEILMSPASVIFLYAVIYGPRELVNGTNVQESVPEFAVRRVNDVSHDVMREKVDNALNCLARHLCYEIVDPDQDDSIKGIRGANRPHLSQAIDIRDDGCRNGVPSRIRLNGGFITALEVLSNEESDNMDQVLTIQFVMAKTICHELAHAVGCATDSNLGASMESCWKRVREKRSTESPPIRREPYFENEPAAELGRSWEQSVFNGNISWGYTVWISSDFKRGNLDEPTYFKEWPVFFEEHIYRRLVPDKPNFKPRETEYKYLLPLSFLHQLHQQAFWDQVGSDETALFAPKIVSIVYLRRGLEPGGRWTPRDVDMEALRRDVRRAESDKLRRARLKNWLATSTKSQ